MNLNELLDIPINEYHTSTNRVTSTGFKYMAYDFFLYEDKYVKELPQENEDTSYFLFGRYVHALILRDKEELATFVTYTGKIRRGKEWDTFKEENKDMQILTRKEFDLAKKMRQEVDRNIDIDFNTGYAEKTIIGFYQNQDRYDGVMSKIRPDWISPDGKMIVDIKTCRDLPTEANIRKYIEDYNYDLSAALYTQIFSQTMGVEPTFYFLFISKGPVKARLVKVGVDTVLKEGHKKLVKGLKNLHYYNITGKLKTLEL